MLVNLRPIGRHLSDGQKSVCHLRPNPIVFPISIDVLRHKMFSLERLIDNLSIVGIPSLRYIE